MKVKKRTLLILVSIVWLIAGFNIIRIGILSYTGHVTVVNILLSALVFAVFWLMVFYKLVIRHTDRIQNYEDELQFFWHFRGIIQTAGISIPHAADAAISGIAGLTHIAMAGAWIFLFTILHKLK